MQIIFKALIRIYQLSFSLILTPCCRFHPTCSNYAIEAIQTHGSVKGAILAVKRIFKCNPTGGSGYDPVPLSITYKERKL